MRGTLGSYDLLVQHHRHAGLVGRWSADGGELIPHPDTARADAAQVWIPLPDPTGRSIDALEGVLCVPTRSGVMRVVAVPHVASHLAMGDELAVADWDGEPLARGELASSLLATVRVVTPTERSWRDVAHELEDAHGEDDAPCWYDVVGDQSVAIAVPRAALGRTFETLERLTREWSIRWEYATPHRHTASQV